MIILNILFFAAIIFIIVIGVSFVKECLDYMNKHHTCLDDNDLIGIKKTKSKPTKPITNKSERFKTHNL